MVADFWGTGNQDALIQKITQKYAHRTLLSQVEVQGFAAQVGDSMLGSPPPMCVLPP